MDNKKEYLQLVKELETEQEKGRKKCVLSSKVFEWVLENIPKESRILELGSGKSSSIFSLLYEIDSIEHDERYVGKYKEVNYIHAPIKEYEKYYWYDLKVLEERLGSQYDLIIMDGPTGKTGREGFAENFHLFQKYDCSILIDETDRKKERKILDCFLGSGFKKIFEGNDFTIIKSPNPKTELNEKLVSKLLINENIVVCSIGDVEPPKWLKEKENYDVCLIHSGNDVEFGQQKLKPLADYFISEKGTKEHNYREALEVIPKIRKYEKIIYLDDDSKISAKELEEMFAEK